MNENTIYKLIVAPYTTEKSVMAADKSKQFSFKVQKNATKTQIKTAIEKIFNVAVTRVNVLNVKGKTKRFRQVVGKRSGWKKAMVSLAEGHDINLAEFE